MTFSARRAATLVELVATLLIISALAGIGVLTYRTVQDNARDRAATEVVRSVATQAQQLAASSRGQRFSSSDLTAAVDSLPARDGSGSGFTATTQGSTGFGLVSVPDSASADQVSVAMVSASGRCIVATVPLRGDVSVVTRSAAGGCQGSASDSDPGGGSEESPEVPQVAGLTATAGDASATLEWNAVAAPTVSGYRVYQNGQLRTTVTGRTTTSAPIDALVNGEMYSFEVSAFTAAGLEGAPSNAVSVRPTPDPNQGTPIALTATAGDRRVTLSWNGIATASSYRVLRDDTVIDDDERGTAYIDTDPNLVPGRTYTYRVVGYGTAGTRVGESSTATAIPTGVLAPQQPPTPTATGAYRSVTVSWPTVATASSYDVRYASGNAVASPAIPQATVNGLADATSYSFEVRACNASGCGPWSLPASTRTAPAIPAPSAAASGLTVTVTWSAPATAARYELQRRTGSGAWGTSTSLTTNSFADSATTAGTTYGYRVRACNAQSACSDFSTQATSTTAPAAPALSGTVSQRTTTLNWNAPTAASRYEVTRLDAGVQANAVTGTTWSQSGLAAETSYSYQVRACNTAGCSAWSNIITLATVPVNVLFVGGCDPFGGSYMGDSSGRCSAQWFSPVASTYNITWRANGAAASPTYSTASASGGPWQGTLGDNTVTVQPCNAAGCGNSNGFTIAGAPKPPAPTVTPDGCWLGYCSFTASSQWATSYEFKFTNGSDGLVYCSNGCWGNNLPGLWSSSWYPQGLEWSMHANGCSTALGGCPAQVSVRQWLNAFAFAVVNVQASNFYYCTATPNVPPTVRCDTPVRAFQ
jgi:type II secretory pathway pseudopilin PulG/fibronectin type 3 domain-containing protein